MKQMNLIPQEVKQKRKQQELKKIGAVVLLLPIGIVAQSYLSMAIMKSDITKLKETISEAKSIQLAIEKEERLIEKNRSILINLTSGGLPLNEFLLYTGVNLPKDIRLYSIRSEAVTDGNVVEGDGTTAETEETPTTPVLDTTTETEGETPAPEETEDIQVEVVKNNIIIQGAALNVDSIGTFMKNLETSHEYIAKVDISDVQNFYNGAFNYKLFELVVELNN